MSKDDDVRNASSRRRNLLYLMHRQLQDTGFWNVADMLKTEARLSEEYEICDNIDLDSVYLDYASYFQLRFGKYPKVLRRVQTAKIELTSARPKVKKSPNQTARSTGTKTEAPPPADAADGLQITVKKIDTNGSIGQNGGAEEQLRTELALLQEIEHCTASGADQLLHGQLDWQSLVEIIKSTILRDEVKLSWSDVCGNVQAIEVIKEAVLAPINYPQLFAHGLKPWKSMLLHGPPGSGKTLLARVLYAETRKQVTFFHITSSVIVSKWRGESEKLVRVLFHVAYRHAPSIVFLDEIESLTSKRDRGNDHEASKRFKNEFLQLLDGMEAEHTDGVFLLATTNLPWDIDDAFLRRFEKKLLVQLPNAVERTRLIHRLLPLPIALNHEQLKNLVQLSEHFTGDEIRLACKNIAMESVRRATHGRKDAAAGELQIEKAFQDIKPTSVKLMPKYQKWQEEHGS